LSRPRALGEGFFARSVHEVAHDLIGCTLLFGGCGGVIVETESYDRDDPACHAFGGRTPRNEVLFGPPGLAYVYISYGIHRMLNMVAESDGHAAAALIRAIEPTAGVAEMRRRRGDHGLGGLCSGPGKLAQALGVGLEHNGASLSRAPFRVLEPAADWRDTAVVAGPRIGITRATELPWRFSAARNRFVSRPRPPTAAVAAA
jgi:DNA-3-methyladenine glycosylase